MITANQALDYHGKTVKKPDVTLSMAKKIFLQPASLSIKEIADKSGFTPKQVKAVYDQERMWREKLKG